jgi:hypothetical protein
MSVQNLNINNYVNGGAAPSSSSSSSLSANTATMDFVAGTYITELYTTLNPDTKVNNPNQNFMFILHLDGTCVFNSPRIGDSKGSDNGHLMNHGYKSVQSQPSLGIWNIVDGKVKAIFMDYYLALSFAQPEFSWASKGEFDRYGLTFSILPGGNLTLDSIYLHAFLNNAVVDPTNISIPVSGTTVDQTRNLNPVVLCHKLVYNAAYFS